MHRAEARVRLAKRQLVVDVQRRSVYVINGINNSRAEAVGYLELTVENFPPSAEQPASYPNQNPVSQERLRLTS